MSAVDGNQMTEPTAKAVWLVVGGYLLLSLLLLAYVAG